MLVANAKIEYTRVIMVSKMAMNEKVLKKTRVADPRLSTSLRSKLQAAISAS